MVSNAQKVITASYVEMLGAIHGWPPVSREYIGIALEKIEAGEEECEMQRPGLPKLEPLYQLALKLEGEGSPKH